VNRSFLSSPAWLRSAVLIFLVAAACVLAAGCGGGNSSSSSSSSTTRNADTNSRQGLNCTGSKVAAERAAQRHRLNTDLVKLRRAAATVRGAQTQNGNARINAALDRFSLDVGKEVLSAHARSSYIDRAAAIVAPKCYLCFQALEANRPTGAAAKLPCD
jgi:hypothetical protein